MESALADFLVQGVEYRVSDRELQTQSAGTAGLSLVISVAKGEGSAKLRCEGSEADTISLFTEQQL